MGYGTKSELHSALDVQIKKMDEIADVIEVDGENIYVSEEKAAAFTAARDEATRIREHLANIDSLAEMKSYRNDPVTRSVADEIAAGMHEAFGAEMKSLGEMFTQSEEFKHLLKTGRQTMDSPWQVEDDLVAYGQKDLHTRSAPTRTTLGFGRTQFDPLVPRAQRTQRVRDLFPVAQTSANLIDFFRVIGFGVNRLDLSSGARPVAERTAADGVSPGNAVYGLKPQSNLKFEAASAPVRTIAHFETAHRNVLADEPQLQSLINNELMYGLRLEEDKQILLGTGTGEDLLGLLNTPNLQVYTQANDGAAQPKAKETKADALRRAATKAALAYYEPSGYVMHPYDFEDIELTKTTDGAYVIASNVQVGAQRQAWRQPVVESPMMPQGTFVTGAWGLGAQLYDRQQANIRIAEQHADFFIRNAIVVLAEQRLAFAVKRPESFVKGSFVGN